MTDDFDSEVGKWFDELEGRLAPAGRLTPSGPDEEAATEPRQLSEPEPDQELMGPARRQPQLVEHKREPVRSEALVDVE